jgi:hypothetical protein
VLATSFEQRRCDHGASGERAKFHTLSKKLSSIKWRVRGHVATLPKTMVATVSSNFSPIPTATLWVGDAVGPPR